MKTITLEQAKNLKPGDIIYHVKNKNSDGTAQRWKVNGKVQTWKKNPNRVKVPLKYGLYRYDYLTENELDLVTLEEPERVKSFTKNNIHIDL
ncbi:MAG: hypothetical protein PHN56_07265 [Candidatus Nanoarchaeia archaeon]|nr:hypothetical protein [Candidatus Nanoarchaeia archaeon]